MKTKVPMTHHSYNVTQIKAVGLDGITVGTSQVGKGQIVLSQ